MNPLDKLVDPFHVNEAFARVVSAWSEHPDQLQDKTRALTDLLQDTMAAEFSRFLEEIRKSSKNGKDEKAIFLDFVRNYAKTVRKCHSIFGKWCQDLTENVPDLDEIEVQRATFWLKQWLSATNPMNQFWTNPTAVSKFIQTNGESIQNGINQWLDDVKRGDSLIRLTDDSAFRIGENIATTPGQVVFRNQLMELIQYAPTTQTTWAVPMVLIQPWINKYYIFDLSPANSFVKYLVDQGFTVFITSWKNPDPGMRHVHFEDYMLNGALEAIRVAGKICGIDKVHVAGYCIGGTVLAALMAWLNKRETDKNKIPVMDWTIFASLVDFSQPGDIKAFISDSSIEFLEALMEGPGYLDKKFIAQTFRMLNPDSLIWRYVINNYLQGLPPPKSDILFWNSDGTRLPEAMCSFFLRQCYLHNRLIQPNALILGNQPIDLGTITQPLYAVAAVQDHISPWKGVFQICHHVNGSVSFVLSAEGHITGIVNPPSQGSRKKYWTGDVGGATKPDEWITQQVQCQGSWWPHWVQWLEERSLEQTSPPSMGISQYPPICPAPGTYVFEP